jgi:hypothetical protein
VIALAAYEASWIYVIWLGGDLAEAEAACRSRGPTTRTPIAICSDRATVIWADQTTGDYPPGRGISRQTLLRTTLALPAVQESCGIQDQEIYRNGSGSRT